MPQTGKVGIKSLFTRGHQNGERGKKNLFPSAAFLDLIQCFYLREYNKIMRALVS